MGAMMRIGLATLAVAASASVACAGTYVGLGIGTAASGSSDQSGDVEGVERSGRLMVGTRFSKVSIEGQASRFDLGFRSSSYDATQLGLGLKLSFPLGHHFEAFGRGGIERTWLSSPNGMYDADGNGWFLGGGFEYRLNLGLTAASLFVDYQRSSTDFTNDRMSQFDATASMWTLGATLAL